MPKIDWNPGQGRRGRPLRRVLGMGQQQGLMVMYGIAAVAILFALAAAFGVFDGSGAKPASQAGGTSTDSGGPGGAAPGGSKDPAKSTQILLASVQHYADLLASGQKIVDHTHYANAAAYGQAFSDSKSPAAQFEKFRTSPNPESDTTYVDAEHQAAASDGDHGGALDQWANDMAKVKSALGDWVVTAARYQQGAAPQTALDAAAATVTQDLATAKSDAASLAK